MFTGQEEPRLLLLGRRLPSVAEARGIFIHIDSLAQVWGGDCVPGRGFLRDVIEATALEKITLYCHMNFPTLEDVFIVTT